MNDNTTDDMHNQFETKFARAQTELADRREKLAAWFRANGQPEELPCKLHPEVLRLLDIEASDMATGYDETKTAVYAPCSRCAADMALRTQNSQLRNGGVPRNLLHCTFGNWKPEMPEEVKHMERVKEFAEHKHGFLIMLGAVGTGKSHLAVALMRLFPGAIFRKQSTLLYELRKSYRDHEAPDPIEPCQRASLLVLDEMGLSSGGRDELPMLHEILDHRYCEFKPTVLTGNIQWPELAKVLGVRLADRLKESRFAVLEFAGPSHREARLGQYHQKATVKPNQNGRAGDGLNGGSMFI